MKILATIKLYFSTVKILAHKPIDIPAVATVTCYWREKDRETEIDRQTDRQRLTD